MSSVFGATAAHEALVRALAHHQSLNTGAPGIGKNLDTPRAYAAYSGYLPVEMRSVSHVEPWNRSESSAAPATLQCAVQPDAATAKR